MKKVVIATGGSAGSRAAVVEGLKLAHDLGAAATVCDGCAEDQFPWRTGLVRLPAEAARAVVRNADKPVLVVKDDGLHHLRARAEGWRAGQGR